MAVRPNMVTVKSKYKSLSGVYRLQEDHVAYQSPKYKTWLYKDKGKWFLGTTLNGTSCYASVKDDSEDPTAIKGEWVGGALRSIKTIEDPEALLAACPSGVAVSSRWSNMRGGYVRVGEHDLRPAYLNLGRKAIGKPMYLWYCSDEGGWLFSPDEPGTDNPTRVSFTESDVINPCYSEWPKIEEVYDIRAVTWLTSPPTLEEIPARRKSKAYGDELYVDKDFPPELSSTGLPEGTPCEWIRCLDLNTDKVGTGQSEQLFDHIEPNDLCQGGVGNCWLLTAIASVAEFPKHIETLFDTEVITKEGKYGVQLYSVSLGKWENFQIDDFIPCRPRPWYETEAKTIFTKLEGLELWPLLLEKAFARLTGSYMGLKGGYTSQAWQALTGCEEQYMWDKVPSTGLWTRYAVKLSLQKEEMAAGDKASCPFRRWKSDPKNNDEDMWKYLTECDKNNYIMSASIVGKVVEKARADGLIELHAYSLIQCREVAGKSLVQLRNPWGGAHEWNGAWSDESPQWDDNDAVFEELHPNEADDGMFWMSKEDFMSIFTKVYVSPLAMKSKRGGHKQAYGHSAAKKKIWTKKPKPAA